MELSWLLQVAKYYSGDKIKEDETKMWHETETTQMHKSFGKENLKEIDRLKNLSVGMRKT